MEFVHDTTHWVAPVHRHDTKLIIGDWTIKLCQHFRLDSWIYRSRFAAKLGSGA